MRIVAISSNLTSFLRLTCIPCFTGAQISLLSRLVKCDARIVGCIPFNVSPKALHIGSSNYRHLDIECQSKSDVVKDPSENVDDKEEETDERDYDEMFAKVTDGDPALIRALKLFKMRLDLIGYSLGIKPVLTENRARDFLLTNPNHRVKLLYIILLRTLKQKSSKKEKLKRAEEKLMEERLPMSQNDYSLFHNALFIRIQHATLRHMNISRAFSSVMYSEEIFIDCSYQNYMNRIEHSLLAKQIANMISDNNSHLLPFKLVFCNLKDSDILKSYLPRFKHTIFHNDQPFFLDDESYLKWYPKEKFVYLTPHCNAELEEFDSDRRYIIGAFVDKRPSKHVSLAKAKELGIETRKFPIDKYIKWGIGRKALPINHCLQIMLDLRFHKNWNKAFNVIPGRFCLPPETRNETKAARQNNLLETVKKLDAMIHDNMLNVK